MKAFLICSAYERDREVNLNLLTTSYPYSLVKIDAVYPSKQHIPFEKKILAYSAARTGKALMRGELGCLMSHRKVWRRIILESQCDQEHFMVFESDSRIVDASFIHLHADELTASCDMFFWGAWEGHTKLFRSSKKNIDKYIVGIPFIKTVYCTYGYSLNRKAAKLLLQRTAKPSWAVDQFKYYFKPDELRLGAILPEVVVGNEAGSTIREKENILLKKLFLIILGIKNSFICFFR